MVELPDSDAVRKLTEAVERLTKEYQAREPPGKPVGIVGRYSGSDTSYQTVVSWTVGQIWERDHGRLDEVSMNSSEYTKTLFRLTVEGKIFFKELQLQSDLTLPFRPPNELRRGEVVKIECRSSDGTNIITTATISAREF